MVADHDQDQKVAEHAVLQAMAHAKSKSNFRLLFFGEKFSAKNFRARVFFEKGPKNKFLFLDPDRSKNEVLDHQKDANDQGLYFFKIFLEFFFDFFFRNKPVLDKNHKMFLDPDQLVLQSQLPQNLDPEADPKKMYFTVCHNWNILEEVCSILRKYCL